MLTIKNLVDGSEIVPFTLENASTEPRSFKSHVDYVLKCSDPSKRGQGVDSKLKFPWKASSVRLRSEQCYEIRHKNSFRIRVHFVIRDANENVAAPTITVWMVGDFRSIIGYVFNRKPENLRLVLIMEFCLNDVDVGNSPLISRFLN